MASIKVADSGKTYTAKCIINGVDILEDTMRGAGIEYDDDWNLVVESKEDFDWWSRWAMREERIADAIAYLDDQELEDYYKKIEGYESDYEVYQDRKEAALGIEQDGTGSLR